MAKTVQVVGIPGSGKSYLLSKYFQIYQPKEFDYFEFGQRLRALRNEDKERHDLDFYVRKLIQNLKDCKKSKVISSHLVHREKDNYHWDFTYDRITDSSAYIHILTNPEQLYKQRMKDNSNNTKQRTIDSIDTLAEHQELSLEKTIEIASELQANVLILKNDPKQKYLNLMIMDEYFREHLT